MPTGHRPMPPTGTAKVEFMGTEGSTAWANIMYVLIGGTFTFSNVLSLAGSLRAAYSTHLVGGMSNQVSLRECRVTGYDGAGNPQGSYSPVTAGGDTTQYAGSAECCVLQWKIPASWRGGKPRTYLPGITIANHDTPHTLSDSYVGSRQTDALAFLNAVNAITETGITSVALGTVSFEHALAWRTPPVFFPYVGVGVQKRVCTQRRRLGALLS